jgi:hypothetical protein
MEVEVESRFPAARRHLEDAYRHIQGDDELSVRSRQALEILIDAFLAAEFTSTPKSPTVIEFPQERARAGGRGR